MDLYLLQYNNYFNRIVKKENTLRDYTDNYDSSVTANANFNPNDGVNTEHIFNWENSFIPNYLICAREDEIISRWFVISWTRLRNKQYKAILRRDVIVDNYESVLSSPIFVEKATLQDNDPMIYNSEGQSYNQIKTSETTIGNDICAWAMIYCAPNQELTDEINLSVTASEPDVIEINTTLEGWEFYKYVENTGKVIDRTTMNYGINTIYHKATGGTENWHNEFSANDGSRIYTPLGYSGGNPSLTVWVPTSFRTKTADLLSEDIDDIFDDAETFLESQQYFISKEDYDDFITKFNGKTIKTSDSKYYKILIPTVGFEEWTKAITNESGSIYSDFNGIIDVLKVTDIPSTDTKYVYGSPNNNTFYIKGNNTTCFRVVPEIRTDITATFKLSDIIKSTEASAYKIYCIPFPKSSIEVCTAISPTPHQFTMTKEVALDMCSSLITKLGSKCYDVQILPYCPLDLRVDNTARVLILAPVVGKWNAYDSDYYTIVSNNNVDYGIVFSMKSSKHEATINKSITSTDPIKVQNECNTYRLVSPNYAGEFEFNLAKNGGSIDYFTISCDYKPYQPLIIVQPHFQGLYGQNFNDARGLILSGDFSVPSNTSEWIQYQINNKNYETIFNRQIEHMDFMSGMQHTQDVVSAFTGSLSGASSGAITGLVTTGSPIGAAIGGAVGGATSLAGGIGDIAINSAIRKENRQFAIDNYNYSLGNIKARPYSINKVGCLNNNFKYFPFIEYYTCTDVEKEALKNKLKYDGMTVMRIGTVSEFLQSERSFIKGKYIRLEDLGDDNYMAMNIYEELSKGVYI